jgi:cytochrome c oxidase assembly protein subunit 20
MIYMTVGMARLLIAYVVGLGSIWPACNWAVGVFALASIIAHEFCQRRRVRELDGIKKAMEMMRELKIQKQKEKEQEQAAKEAACLAKEEGERGRKIWTNLSSYKFW